METRKGSRLARTRVTFLACWQSQSTRNRVRPQRGHKQGPERRCPTSVVPDGAVDAVEAAPRWLGTRDGGGIDALASAAALSGVVKDRRAGPKATKGRWLSTAGTVGVSERTSEATSDGAGGRSETVATGVGAAAARARSGAGRRRRVAAAGSTARTVGAVAGSSVALSAKTRRTSSSESGGGRGSGRSAAGGPGAGGAPRSYRGK